MKPVCQFITTPEGGKFRHYCPACGYVKVANHDTWHRECPAPFNPHASNEPPESERRRAICRPCTDRPAGCWKAIEFGCEIRRAAAEKHAVNFGRCPLDYWRPPDPDEFISRNAKKAAVAKRRCPLGKLDAYAPDRVVVINLAYRKDLRQQGEAQIAARWPAQWPTPLWFDAVNGWKDPACTWHRNLRGAWGCRQSHLAVLSQARADGISDLLVLEGDFVLCDNFAVYAAEFFANVPADWELAYLGGQHRKSAPVVAADVVRVRSLIRTHAYVARAAAQEKLLNFWGSVRTHIDNALANHLEHEYRAYAPRYFLVGQNAVKSDIMGRKASLRFWTPPRPVAAVTDKRRISILREKRQALLSGKPRRKETIGFVLTVYHEPPQLVECCLQRIRRSYPAAAVAVISDGGGNFAAIAGKYAAKYVPGERLKIVSRGAVWWARTLQVGLSLASDWIAKIDADTRIHRAFQDFPQADILGSLQGPYNTQGGIQLFSRNAAMRILGSHLCELPKYFGTEWNRTAAGYERWNGQMTTDWTMADIAKTLKLNVMNWIEIDSQWRGTKFRKEAAATHPHKEAEPEPMAYNVEFIKPTSTRPC